MAATQRPPRLTLISPGDTVPVRLGGTFMTGNSAGAFFAAGGPGGDNTFTDPSGTAGAGFGFRNQTPDITSSNAVLGSGGPRAIQLGLKLIF